jgi:hypothetical protein
MTREAEGSCYVFNGWWHVVTQKHVIKTEVLDIKG